MAWSQSWSKNSRSLELLTGTAPSLDAFKSCAFFHGPEAYAAETWVERAIEAARRGGGEIEVTRYYLDETLWPEIIDAARTSLLFSAVRRVFIVRYPEKARDMARKNESSPALGPRGGRGRKTAVRALPDAPESEEEEGAESGDENEAGGKYRFIDAADKSDLERYFAEPQDGVSIVVYRIGAVKPGDSVVRFFTSLPDKAVASFDVGKLQDRDLLGLLELKARALDKRMGVEARKALVRTVGLDPRLLMNEMDKLAAFAGDRREIEEDDVERVTAWLKTQGEFALAESMMKDDYAASIRVLNGLLDEGVRPELMVGGLTGMLRRFALAEALLAEKGMARDEVFQALYPNIRPMFSFYRDRFNEFFGRQSLIDAGSLRGLVRRLQETDARMKSTETDPGILLEVFVFEFYKAIGK